LPVDIFSQIYRTYRNHIFNYFYRTLHNSHIAEELTHDTFLKAFRSLNSFRGEASLKNWLYIIAVNTNRNFLAKGKTAILDETNHLVSAPDAFKQVEDRILIEQVFEQLPS